MYTTTFIVLVACSTFSSVTSDSPTTPTPTPLPETKTSKLKTCFYQAMEDIVTKNSTNRTCGSEFAEVTYIKEELKSNRTYSEMYVGLLKFVLNHDYSKAFIQNGSCMNETTCRKEAFGEYPSNISTSVAPEDIQPEHVFGLFFNTIFKQKYNLRTCHGISRLGECLQNKELSTCDYHTGKFYMDMFAYLYEACKNHTTNNKGKGGNASGLASTLHLVAFSLAAISLLR